MFHRFAREEERESSRREGKESLLLQQSPSEMQDQHFCPRKTQNVWAVLWAICLQWLMVVFQVLIHTIEGIPALRQLLEVSGLRPLYIPGSQAASLPHKTALLPRRDKHDADKLTVVLDLDETLVCAYESTGLPPQLHDQASCAGVKWFQLQCVAADKDSEGKPRVNHVTVYERPGLQEFLKRASEFAELVLFTAGLEGYASPLVDRIDPEKRIAARLYRSATVSSKYREHVKDLSCLGRDLRRTVIIDNNPFSFVLQPLNGIPCVPFTGEHSDDQQLLEVILPLLQYLALQDDIRPALDERFHMPAWFSKRGIPTSDWSA